MKLATRCFEDTHSNQQRAGTNRQGSMRMHACLLYPKKKKRNSSRQASVLDIFKSSSGTRTSPLVQLDVGNYDSDGPPTIEEEVSPPSIFICLFYIFCKPFIRTNISSWSKHTGTIRPILTLDLCENLSRLTSPVWEPPMTSLRCIQTDEKLPT